MVPMSRRYPNLKQKVLKRDGEIAKKIILSWDIEKDHEKALQIFLHEKYNLSDERYWELLRTIWVISGCLDNVNLFRRLMMCGRPQKFYFSTPEDAKKLRELPEIFEVYRACNDDHDGGISWTLSKDYAKSYKKEYSKSYLITRTIEKFEVFALIQRNLESEIIIL
jgi:hypothetical protein